MRVSVKLGGPLRKRIPGHDRGELSLDLEPGSMVSDVLSGLDIGGDVVRVLMLNGKPIVLDMELVDGDRLSLFPRELAFNMYVATNFFNPLARPEIEKKLKAD